MSRAAGLAEAFGFTALVLVDIWYLRPLSGWWDLLPATFAFASWVAHRETISSLGLRMRDLAAALKAWRWPLIVAGAAAATGCFLADHPWHLLYRGSLYLLWCILQQLLLQNMIYRRVRVAIGASWGAWLLTGILFAATHVPNPVLVPATLFWGAFSAFLFEQRPAIVAIALLQTFFSALLFWVTPADLSHQFRVGPGYWYQQ